MDVEKLENYASFIDSIHWSIERTPLEIYYTEENALKQLITDTFDFESFIKYTPIYKKATTDNLSFRGFIKKSFNDIEYITLGIELCSSIKECANTIVEWSASIYNTEKDEFLLLDHSKIDLLPEIHILSSQIKVAISTIKTFMQGNPLIFKWDIETAPPSSEAEERIESRECITESSIDALIQLLSSKVFIEDKQNKEDLKSIEKEMLNCLNQQNLNETKLQSIEQQCLSIDERLGQLLDNFHIQEKGMSAPILNAAAALSESKIARNDFNNHKINSSHSDKTKLRRSKSETSKNWKYFVSVSDIETFKEPVNTHRQQKEELNKRQVLKTCSTQTFENSFSMIQNECLSVPIWFPMEKVKFRSGLPIAIPVGLETTNLGDNENVQLRTITKDHDVLKTDVDKLKDYALFMKNTFEKTKNTALEIFFQETSLKLIANDDIGHSTTYTPLYTHKYDEGFSFRGFIERSDFDHLTLGMECFRKADCLHANVDWSISIYNTTKDECLLLGDSQMHLAFGDVFHRSEIKVEITTIETYINGNPLVFKWRVEAMSPQRKGTEEGYEIQSSSIGISQGGITLLKHTKDQEVSQSINIDIVTAIDSLIEHLSAEVFKVEDTNKERLNIVNREILTCEINQNDNEIKLQTIEQQCLNINERLGRLLERLDLQDQLVIGQIESFPVTSSHSLGTDSKRKIQLLNKKVCLTHFDGTSKLKRLKSDTSLYRADFDSHITWIKDDNNEQSRMSQLEVDKHHLFPATEKMQSNKETQTDFEPLRSKLLNRQTVKERIRRLMHQVPTDSNTFSVSEY